MENKMYFNMHPRNVASSFARTHAKGSCTDGVEMDDQIYRDKKREKGR